LLRDGTARNVGFVVRVLHKPLKLSRVERADMKAKSMINGKVPPEAPLRPPVTVLDVSRVSDIDFPVVALGASAGGLDTFKRFFDALPAASGMAFVLIQHLDPNHKSLMVDLLAGHTSMRIVQATDQMTLEPNHVYMIPPAVSMAIKGGTLHLSEPLQRHGTRMPLDFFLRSLAEECGQRAIAVILSGTGTDGSLGLKAIKEQGGLIIVQDPEEAAFDGMPRSAIQSGGADFVLPVARIPEAIMNYATHAYLKTKPRQLTADASVTPDRSDFGAIINLLGETTPHNFSLYKAGTLERRIERRMAMAGIESSDHYLAALQNDATERDLLSKDLLINVTHFFRDTAAFDLLNDSVIPGLVQHQTSDRPLRVWVPGCSTGEEAYSLAMLFLEQIATAKRSIKLQVFASDIDADCVTAARNGVYPESIAADVTPARLARFFTKTDHSYRVVRELREAVVFTGQSLLADAPFSRLDLVSCRNLLIYLTPDAQRKVLSLFHFSLREGGILFLGSSETVGGLSDRFEAINKKFRIYKHIGHSRPGEVEFPVRSGTGVRAVPKSALPVTGHRPVTPSELAQRSLLESYAPASVLINAKFEGLHYFGATDRFLKVAAGHSTADVLAMAREGLSGKLRSAVQRARTEAAAVTITGAKLQNTAGLISITARPVECNGAALILVSFIEEPIASHNAAPIEVLRAHAEVADAAEVERELDATRRELQGAIADLEASNEEQKAINEEAMSLNEEFQSTNEELETSKEELQSLNEELTALNGQLHETVEQQRATSNDLKNILDSTDVATLFLDHDLKIRFFTPATKSLFNIIASDIGRPLADFTRRFQDDDLLADAASVLIDWAAVRREIRASDGGWYIRSMLPYRSDGNRVQGVVITFSSISEIKAVEQALELAKAEAERANLGKSRFLAAASHDLRQPLQTISLLQGILAKRVQEEPLLKIVHRLDETVGAMSSMLDKLLDINQLEAGVVHKDVVDFPIANILGILRTEFAYTATTRGLGWHVAASGAVVRSDPRLLEQIVRNLIANAMKYTAKGKILLGCRRRGDKLRIEVWDTGLGIPERELRAIFDEFHQLDNSARELSKGLGLGLTIVQRLADLLGHTIDVRSRVGVGSVFSIEVDLPPPPELSVLPVRESKSAPFASTTSSASTASSAAMQGTILIVEDNPNILEMLELLLDDAGHKTLTATNGPRAVELIAQSAQTFDLVITDFNLPDGLNGLQTVEALRAQVRREFPAIVLTGDISTASLREIAAQGRSHLTKPVRAAELCQLVQTLLRGAKPTVKAELPAVLESKNGAETSTIYVIDDDVALRETMRELLQGHGYCVEIFAGGTEFIDAYRSQPGCVLVDALMPGMSGLEVIAKLRAAGHAIPAIILTGHGDIGMAVKAMKAGAVDFIEKPAGADELLASVAQALALSHDLSTASNSHAIAGSAIAALTTRQREILNLVLEGAPSKNIAADLGISQRTVDNHRAAIMKKTGSRTLSALIRTAIAAA
jgi:two-component system, chemotaxis family, CheB/CheR fusion protein